MTAGGEKRARPGKLEARDLVLGIDGGGTKTVAWLAPRNEPDERAVAGRGVASGSNVRTGGIATAASNLDRAIENAFADAGLRRGRVASACVAAAGCDRDAERAMVQQWAREAAVAEQVIVTNDALPILYAASAGGCGIALIAGTGSLAFGRNSQGSTARSGGWGPLFGDEGSGYQIALAGLRAAARFADGRGPETALLRACLSRWGLREPSELVPAIYAPGVDRAQIAGTAEVVFQAAQDGDAVAVSIVKDASTELAEMVTAVARRLEYAHPSIPLALSGGVLLAQPMLRKYLLTALADAELTVAPVSVPHPVAGALRIAAAASSE